MFCHLAWLAVHEDDGDGFGFNRYGYDRLSVEDLSRIMSGNLGFRVVEKPTLQADASIFLGESLVFYNPDRSSFRKIYALGCELGHILLHFPHPKRKICQPIPPVEKMNYYTDIKRLEAIFVSSTCLFPQRILDSEDTTVADLLHTLEDLELSSKDLETATFCAELRLRGNGFFKSLQKLLPYPIEPTN